MAPLEELQQIWRHQPLAEMDLRRTWDALDQFGRRQHIINTLKLVLLGFETWFCFTQFGLSPLTVCGQALFIAGALNIVLRDWRNQAGIARMDFSTPSVHFVNRALARLDGPNDGMRKRLWRNLLVVCCGLNLIIYSRPSASAPLLRALIHLGLSTMLLGAAAVGVRLHAQRCRLEYRPIRKQLLAMKLALQEKRL